MVPIWLPLLVTMGLARGQQHDMVVAADPLFIKLVPRSSFALAEDDVYVSRYQ
jgi:hypothetical protein